MRRVKRDRSNTAKPHLHHGAAFGAVLSVVLLATAATAAKTPRRTVVKPTELAVTSIPWEGRTREIGCRGKIPGDVSFVGSKTYFFSFRDQMNALKLKIQKAKAKKRTALLAQRKKLNTLLKLTGPICANLPKDPTATATPTPSATPQNSINTPLPVTPTSTPTSMPGTPVPTLTPTATRTPTLTPTQHPLAIFDSQGNVTTVGKEFLAIPPQYSANIDRGDAATKFHCAGCHAERTMYKYDQLYPRVTEDPMFLAVPETVTFEELADITAYLNRFRDLAQD